MQEGRYVFLVRVYFRGGLQGLGWFSVGSTQEKHILRRECARHTSI